MLNNFGFQQLPVLIIGFERIEHIRKLIYKLKDFGVCNILVSLDFSPKKEIRFQQELLVKEFDKPSEIQMTNIQFWLKTRNHGIAANVVSSIDWLFASHEVGVIFEDDLDFESDFLKFCYDALGFYLDSTEVCMISGNRFDEETNSCVVGAVTYPQIWGWATWRHKWKEMRNLILKPSYRTIMSPPLAAKAFFRAGSRRVHDGVVDTWDTPLAYEFLCSKRLCVIPPINLVTNLGNDQFAIHTQRDSFSLNFPIKSLEKVEYLTVNELRKESQRHNLYLERQVFLIRWFHIFSPVKYWLQRKLILKGNPTLVPLRKRIEQAENFEF